MICKKCGCRVSDTAAFCDKCGAPMAEFGEKEPEAAATAAIDKKQAARLAKILVPVVLILMIVWAASTFASCAKAAKPFGLESGMSLTEVEEILGGHDDQDWFDTVKWGKQYVCCWYDQALGKHQGTLQANFAYVNSQKALGYLEFQPDSATAKELAQYAEKSYGKSDSLLSDSTLYRKDTDSWRVSVSKDGKISWLDTSVMEVTASRAW